MTVGSLDGGGGVTETYDTGRIITQKRRINFLQAICISKLIKPGSYMDSMLVILVPLESPFHALFKNHSC